MTQVKIISVLSLLIPRTAFSTRERAPEGSFIDAPLQRDATRQLTG